MQRLKAGVDPKFAKSRVCKNGEFRVLSLATREKFLDGNHRKLMIDSHLFLSETSQHFAKNA